VASSGRPAASLGPVPRPWGLWHLAALGFAGSACVLVGVHLPGSPFVAAGRSPWILGSSPPAGRGTEGAAQFLGIVLVYAGIAVLLGAWLETLRTVRAQPPAGTRALLPVLGAWTAPLVLAPPLFSRDVYSYAAQGDLVARGIDPDLRAPAVLGPGPFTRAVDPLWLHATAPYGPAWERLAGGVVRLAGGSVAGSAAGFRVVALAGIALLAWAVPDLARSVGADDPGAFTLALLNPLTLLVLVGGAHNDALMLGLAATACALGARGHVVAAVVVCGLAAEIKVPALLVAVIVGWAWWGGPGTARRAARAAAATLGAVGVMAAAGLACRLGWRWVGALFGSGRVVSWLDPATAAGLALHDLARALGDTGGAGPFVTAARLAGLALATLVTLRLVGRVDRIGPVRALGWSLLAFALLGPVVWPWYETWGIAFLAVGAHRAALRTVVLLSALGCVADVTAPGLLVSAPPALVVAGWVAVAGAAAWYLVARRPWSHDEAVGRLASRPVRAA